MKKKGFENCFTLNNISDIIWKIVSLVILLLFITGIAFGMESPQLHADKSDPVDVEQTVQYQIYLPLVLVVLDPFPSDVVVGGQAEIWHNINTACQVKGLLEQTGVKVEITGDISCEKLIGTSPNDAIIKYSSFVTSTEEYSVPEMGLVPISSTNVRNESILTSSTIVIDNDPILDKGPVIYATASVSATKLATVTQILFDSSTITVTVSVSSTTNIPVEIQTAITVTENVIVGYITKTKIITNLVFVDVQERLDLINQADVAVTIDRSGAITTTLSPTYTQLIDGYYTAPITGSFTMQTSDTVNEKEHRGAIEVWGVNTQTTSITDTMFAKTMQYK
ncbi:MAG: hypothetical protein B6242_11865, partial [Anaerolineaceae bacterium 4572_78]